VIKGENPYPIQATVTCKDGTTKEIIFLYSVMDEMGIIAFYDITERVEAENRLQEYISIVDENVLVVRSDENAVMTSVSTAFCRLFGYTEEEMLGKPAMIVNHEEFLRDVQPVVMETILAGRVWTGEIKKVAKNGDIFWVQSMIQPVFDNGVRTGFLSISNDITDKKRIEILSVTDKLTGVYNRIRLDEVLSTEFVRFKRYEQSYSVIMFDIDYFKRVNDTYGHLAGDDVLKSLAQLVKASIRESDIFGRWGGEEFLVVCCGTDVEGAHNLAEKLRQKVEIFAFPAVDRLTCSFGVAQVDDAGTDNMVKRADEALYRAKQGGRNRVEI
jgi:diguanylate cyclase (GGDEF)-like protein/PAS domain S-box-containing protein